MQPSSLNSRDDRDCAVSCNNDRSRAACGGPGGSGIDGHDTCSAAVVFERDSGSAFAGVKG
eukprot:2981820-Pleurochrysis_carterae.AAC.1